MRITAQDREEIRVALWMRKNYIETGTVTMSANDAVRFNKSINPDSFPKTKPIEIKPLSTDQMKLIIRLEELIKVF